MFERKACDASSSVALSHMPAMMVLKSHDHHSMACMKSPGTASLRYENHPRNALETLTPRNVSRQRALVQNAVKYMAHVPKSTLVSDNAAPCKPYRRTKNHGAANFRGVVETLNTPTRLLNFIAIIVFSATHVTHCVNNPGIRTRANAWTSSATEASTPNHRNHVAARQNSHPPGAAAHTHKITVARAAVSPTARTRPRPFACELSVSTPAPNPQMTLCAVKLHAMFPIEYAATPASPLARDSNDSANVLLSDVDTYCTISGLPSAATARIARAVDSADASAPTASASSNRSSRARAGRSGASIASTEASSSDASASASASASRMRARREASECDARARRRRPMSFFDILPSSDASDSSDADADADAERCGAASDAVDAADGASAGAREASKGGLMRFTDALLDGRVDAREAVRAARGSSALASAVVSTLNAARGPSYYEGGGGREDGEEARAATVRVDARRRRAVEHRVAMRLLSAVGNGMAKEVEAIGARVELDDDIVSCEDRTARTVAVTGTPEAVQKCLTLIDILTREAENQTSKKFYCPKVFLGAFIGRGYGNVRKIEGLSKCKIVISSEDKVHEGDTYAVVRAIEVTGTPAQVSLGYKLALQNLDDALKTAPDAEEIKEELKSATSFDLDAERANKRSRRDVRS